MPACYIICARAMSFAPFGVSTGHVVHVQIDSAVHGLWLCCAQYIPDLLCFSGDSVCKCGVALSLEFEFS